VPSAGVDPPLSFLWILQRFSKGRAARALAGLAPPRVSAEFCRFDGIFGPALRPQGGAEEGCSDLRPPHLAAFTKRMTEQNVAGHASAGSRPSRLAA
jgi:hypothetical protein